MIEHINTIIVGGDRIIGSKGYLIPEEVWGFQLITGYNGVVF